jgi:hypothetical protein
MSNSRITSKGHDDNTHGGGGGASRVLIPLAFSLLTALCVLFAFGVVSPPTKHVENLPDAHGNTYTGELRLDDGEFIGPTRIVFPNGDSYEGGLTEGRFSGEGMFTSANGWSLSGVFEAGRLIGTGHYLDSKGSYEGSFANSLPSGTGTYYSIEGWSHSLSSD